MTVLGIESAALVASAAIISNGVLKAEYTINAGLTHSQTLLPMIAEIIRMGGMDIKDMDAIAVSAGPGSFTGLRIGAGTAKGLGLALERPLIHVPTLAAMAYSLPLCADLICPIMDARRDQVYGGVYDFSDDFKNVIGDCAISIGGFMDNLAPVMARTGRKALFMGDGVPKYRQVIMDRYKGSVRFVPPHANIQRAASVAALGEVYLKEGRTVEADSFVPKYYRDSQAERMRREKLSVGCAGTGRDRAAHDMAARILTKDDANEIEALETALFHDYWTAQGLKEELDNPSFLALGIFANGHLAAYCLSRVVHPEGEILRVATAEGYGRRGFASTLLKTLFSLRNNVGTWFLEVRSKNIPAITLYKGLGFAPCGIRKNYYKSPADDAITMRFVRQG